MMRFSFSNRFVLLRFRVAVPGTLLWAALVCFLPFCCASPTIQSGMTNDLTLHDFLLLVIEHNESLQVRVLEFEIAQKKFNAERGIFEPEVVLSYDRVKNKRENTAEQRR